MSVVPHDAKAALKTHALQTLRDHVTSSLTQRLWRPRPTPASSRFVTATSNRATRSQQPELPAPFVGQLIGTPARLPRLLHHHLAHARHFH